MPPIVRLDLIDDKEIKRGLELIDDAISHFMSIEDHNKRAKLYSEIFYSIFILIENYELNRDKKD